MSTPAPETPTGHHDLSIEKVSKRADDIEGKLPKLKKLVEHARVLLSLVKDYWRGSYREIPYWAISASALALLYVLNPADLFPDFIFGVGYLDDAAVIAFCRTMGVSYSDRGSVCSHVNIFRKSNGLRRVVD